LNDIRTEVAKEKREKYRAKREWVARK